MSRQQLIHDSLTCLLSLFLFIIPIFPFVQKRNMQKSANFCNITWQDNKKQFRTPAPFCLFFMMICELILLSKLAVQLHHKIPWDSPCIPAFPLFFHFQPYFLPKSYRRINKCAGTQVYKSHWWKVTSQSICSQKRQVQF